MRFSRNFWGLKSKVAVNDVAYYKIMLFGDKDKFSISFFDTLLEFRFSEKASNISSDLQISFDIT